MDSFSAWLVAAVVVAVLVAMARRTVGAGRRLRAESARQLALAKLATEPDVNRFGDEVARLSALLVANDPVASDLQHRIAALHVRARAALIEARRPDDLSDVTQFLEAGRWTSARLIARAAGKPVPVRSPPCFFNPGHGPSTTNIVWQRRNVPACAADADRIAAGADPYIRTVQADGGRVPYWEGGPTHAGWARGYYTSWRGNRLVADVASTQT